MVIATALGWGTAASIALAVGLAFSAGYALTALPLLRLGMPFATAAPIVLAADTVSIAVMEVMDNLTVVLVPGAIDADLDDARFWLCWAGSWSHGRSRSP